MTDQEHFEGFDEEKYHKEAEERWGDTPKYKQSMQRWSSFSDEEKEAIKEEGGEITVRMVSTNPDAKPDDPDVQAACADYLAYINKYFYTCSVKDLAELAEMWVLDPRFARNYDGIREGGALFVRDAVRLFAKKNG